MARIVNQPVKITKPGVYLSMGCVHEPFSNKRMLQSLYKLIEKEGIILQGVILAGDILDLNSMSSHAKGMIPLQGVTLGKEYRAGASFIKDIESLSYAKKPEKHFIWGNHEDRYNREVAKIDMSKISDAIAAPQDGMKMDDSWTVQTNWKNGVVQIGEHLDIFHGEFYNIHAAKTTLDRSRKSCLMYHSHRLQVYSEGFHIGFNGGCALDINSPAFGYATKSMLKSWTNAVQLVHLDKDGMFHIQNLTYFNNSFWVNGKRY